MNCSLCQKKIAEKKISRNTYQLLDWVVYEVEGQYCSEKCAQKVYEKAGR